MSWDFSSGPCARSARLEVPSAAYSFEALSGVLWPRVSTFIATPARRLSFSVTHVPFIASPPSALRFTGTGEIMRFGRNFHWQLTEPFRASAAEFTRPSFSFLEALAC